MTEAQEHKLLVIRIALAAVEEYLLRQSIGIMDDVDIETLIVERGKADNVTADEAWNAIEESLIAAFHL